MIIFAKFNVFTWEISATCTGTLQTMVSHRCELKQMSNMKVRLILWDFVFKITSKIFTWTKCTECMICTFWRHVCNKMMNEIDEHDINKNDFQQHEMWWWWTCSICTHPDKIYRLWVKITKKYLLHWSGNIPPSPHTEGYHSQTFSVVMRRPLTIGSHYWGREEHRLNFVYCCPTHRALI